MIANKQIPLLSICCVTYNHEGYIRLCLDGFVNQKTTYPFEVLVHDDASTDSTAAIVKEYETNYPEIFRCVYQKTNQFAIQNTLINILLPMTKGKYIALCEGDDYWIDPLKIQKQLDFMESNADFSMCYTNHSTINENGTILQERSLNSSQSRNLNHTDILSNNYFIGTASILFKKDALPSNSATLFKNVSNGDYFIYSLVTRAGMAAYIDTISTAYRIHQGGTWTSRNSAQKYWAMYRTFLVTQKIFTSSSEQQALKKNLSKILQNLSWAYFELPKNEQIKFIFKSFIISLRFGVFKTWISINSDLITLFMKNKFKFKTA